MREYRAVAVIVGLVAALWLSSPGPSFAQRGPGQRGQGEQDRAQRDRGPGGERGRFDPAQFREMMVERLKEPLGATDEEWKALKPLIADVMEKQTTARMSGFRMFRPSGPSGRTESRAGDQPTPDRGERATSDRGDRPSPFGQPDPEADALQKALDDKATPPKDIEAKLKALRDARTKREEALKQAREKLRQALSVRQEATLVLMGTLD